jgi:hypothetical protein
MAIEIFRFMTIRPPQELDLAIAGKNSVDLNSYPSDLIRQLAKQRLTGSIDAMLRVAQEYRKSNASGFIDSRKKVDARFLSFYEKLAGLGESDFYKAAKNAFAQVFNLDPQKLVASNDYSDLFVKVTNSIAIAAIDPSVSPKVGGLLLSLARTQGFIYRLASSPENPLYTKNDFLSQIIVLPENVFPMPGKDQDVSTLLQREKDRRDKIAQNQAKLVELSQELVANREAVQDLITTFERSTASCQPPVPPSSGNCGFLLSGTDANQLTDGTKEVLKKNGFSLAKIDAAIAVTQLEKKSRQLSNRLYNNRSSMRYMVNIGNIMVPSDEILGNMTTDPGDSSLGTPGACSPAPSGGMDDQVTVPPTNVQNSNARVLGIADLMIVEQDLLRYDPGEISHIENVLKSEVRDRHFTTKTTTEQSTLIETETAEEKTKDLSSTDRFELQTESEKVINESTSTEAGITINASYGPSVDATANFNYTHSNASQESSRASTNFARETTSRATSKIQKRTLERRFLRTVSLVEEFNKHSFDNKDGAGNITGVYRFVDKVYLAQIINYGKRLMLEFLVPEPAAFLRYAKTKQPIDTVTQIKPEPPGYCVNNTFVSLQPKDLDRDNYLFWVGKYNAEDADSPPASMMIVAGSKMNESPGQKSSVTEDVYGTYELQDLNIPDGYRPVLADITFNGWNIAKDGSGAYPHHFSIQVQKQIFYESNILSVSLTSAVTNRIPVSLVTKNYENISVVANIACVLTDEKFQEWQIKTFNSIMNAYNDLQSRYDNAIKTARAQASDNLISGTNPETNRETEKIELKKGCIALLTQQNYDLFDSMKRNAAPYGYPEIAFDDAEVEGRFIQFFENAFEWTNMLYIFYPYFWGNKDEWVTISQIVDDDPLYTRFLQAGSARVQVPVRPGFEKSILHFLNGNGIWYGEVTLVNSEDGQLDPLYVSILDELKEQLSNQNIEGLGRLNVTKDSPQVTGIDTEFTADDENKRILIRGKTYVIKQVTDQTEIQLTKPYQDAMETGVRYSLGPKLVGEPWEVKLPTDLMILDQNNTLAAINAAIQND